MLILKLKQQTCWKILRHFGYDDQLQIREQMWDDQSIGEQDLENCRSVELTKEATTYLKRLFEAYKSENNRLNLSGMEKIFATTVDGVPWKVKSETVYDSGVTFDNWIGLWQKYFNLHTVEAFKNFVYIGYCGRMKDAISCKRYKVRDLLKPS